MKVSEISQIIHTLETDPEFLEGGRLGHPEGAPSYLVNVLEKLHENDKYFGWGRGPCAS